MKPTLLLGYLLIAILIPTRVNAQSGWQWQNPTPQGNDLNGVWVLDQNTILAVGDKGTLLRSTDGGLTWGVTHLLAGVSGDFVDIKFHSEQRGWLLGNRYRTDDGGNVVEASSSILLTADGGTSWNAIAHFDSVRLNDMCFINESFGWALGYVPAKNYADTLMGILLKTTDGGYHWNTLFARSTAGQDEGEDRIPYRSIQFIDENTGWMAGRFYDGDMDGDLLKTSDGGATWSVVNDSMACIEHFQFQDASNGWLIETYSRWVSGYSIKRTLDGGATWQMVFSDAASYDHVPTPSLFFVNDCLGWVSLGGIVYATRDGGVTWLADTIGGVLNSAMHFRDEMHGCVVGACGQVMNTQDGGHSWVRTTRSLLRENLASIDFVDELTGWVVGDTYQGTFEGPAAYGRIFKTTDGGFFWLEQFFVPGGYASLRFADVEAVSHEVAYAAKGAVYKTSDAGISWRELDVRGDRGITTLFFLDERTGFAGVGAGNPYDPGRLYRTTNGGTSWDSVLSAPHSVQRTYFLDPSVGWAVGWENPIYSTTDGGNTWQATSNVNLQLMSVFFTDPRNGCAVGMDMGRGVIIRTVDGGGNWQTVYTSQEYSMFSSVCFCDSLTGYVLGPSAVLYTTDGGISWNVQFEGAGKYLSDICFVNGNLGWVVGADGTILKTKTGGVSYAGDNRADKVPTGFVLLQNYPNPFNPTTVFSYQLPVASEVKLVVYDMLGREVAKLMEGVEEPGYKSVEWNAGAVASGVYFYRLTAADFAQTRKLLVLR